MGFGRNLRVELLSDCMNVRTGVSQDTPAIFIVDELWKYQLASILGN